MKSRTIILGIITLVIGFVLGMLTSAQLRLHRLKPVRMYFSEERFREGLYRTIQPDDAQKAKIDQILDKYGKLNSDIQNNFRKEFEASGRAMRKELDSNLTKEQQARLKEMDERRQEMMKLERERRQNDTTGFRNLRHRPSDITRRPGYQAPPPPQSNDRETGRSAD
ncbi:MAG: hypothetical protein RBT38_00540 [Bacteroidales bacterium]|jgi:hypothetical protein|nr:hypothetical protein [Bacteroidales bacterium]